MDLSGILSEKCILVDTKFTKKDDVLKSIAKLARENPILKNVSEKEIYDGLKKRESLGSTGFEHSIAIPHCPLENISDFVIGIVTVPEGVDFQALDGKDSKLFIFIILPASKRTEHVRILSKISNALRVEKNVQELLNSKSAEVCREIFLRQTYIDEKVKDDKDHNLFHVFIQKEDVFDDILNIFAEVANSNIAVIEGNNAGSYLYKQPLLSTFWSDEEKGFSRIICAVVKKSLSNEIIRKINMIIDDQGSEPGIMLAVQNMFYVNGSVTI